MAGTWSKKIGLEAPNDSTTVAAAADDDNDVFAAGNGGDDSIFHSGEDDQSLFRNEEGDEGHLQDSEGEPEEEEDDEGGDNTVLEGVERPKLDDDFYEIQAIRRKRIRKGQLQYLIKWHGWPETANTWEPLENLQSISDVIDAFEESLRSGKHRKRKRKHAVHHTLPKKRQQRSTTSYSLRQFSTSVADKHRQSAPVSNLNLDDVPVLPHTLIFTDEGAENGDACRLGKDGQANENHCTNVSKLIVERENDSYPNLTELQATAPSMTTNGVDVTDNGHMAGQSKVGFGEPVSSGRCRGAKRRKSGSVKRFKKDSYVCELNNTQKELVGQGWTEADGFGRNYSRKSGDTKSVCDIVEIVKPIGYSASVSSDIPNITVTFTALRSDGSEVTVDNKHLKTYCPHLLINYYEQRLRFHPSLCNSSID